MNLHKVLNFTGGEYLCKTVYFIGRTVEKHVSFRWSVCRSATPTTLQGLNVDFHMLIKTETKLNMFLCLT